MEKYQHNPCNSLYSKGMYSLMHLALADQSGPVSGQSNPLSETLIHEGLGAVYVKSSAVSAFEADSNWGSYRIEPLENYPAELGTIDDSWEEIVEACGDGTYASKYQIGDSKELVVSGSPVLMVIVAMDADVLDSDGVTTVPTTWLSVPLPLRLSYGMNNANGRNASWEDSYLRGRLSSLVITRIENATVRDALKTVRKTFAYRASSDSSIATGSCGDRLWIPSAREILPPDHTYANSYENSGPRYTIANPTRAPVPYRYWYDGTTNTDYYAWTRSMSGYNSNSGGYASYAKFQAYSNSVSLTTEASSNGKPLIIGFCI